TVHLVLSRKTSFNVLLELMYLLWLGVVCQRSPVKHKQINPNLNILSNVSVASSTSSLGEPFVSITLVCRSGQSSLVTSRRSLHKMKMVFLSSLVL
ncbi:hypothetical protein BDR26DRAFT_855211, partial [Obelidium mucronatum]